MANIIVVTPQPVAITTVTVMQDIRTAIDISAYDYLDLQVGLISVGGTGTLTVNFFTAMQNVVDDGSWASGGVNCGNVTFTQADVNKWKGLRLPDTSILLKYLRYQLIPGTLTSATVMISGMARRIA